MSRDSDLTKVIADTIPEFATTVVSLGLRNCQPERAGT
jgi:hypothetical protein